jgi:hypothetical protein
MKESGKQWQRLLDKVTRKCGGRVPAWDDPELNFLSERERILYFSNLVRIWLVQPIEQLRESNRQDPDFGFALLLVVNPIPELLGKLLLGKINRSTKSKEPCEKCDSCKQCKSCKACFPDEPSTEENPGTEGNDVDQRKLPYNEGVRYALSYDLDDKDIRSIYSAIRCALAHNAVIEGNRKKAVASLRNEYELPVEVRKQGNGRDNKNVVYVSPDKFAQTMVYAMNRYIDELRFELNNDGSDRLRKFREYLDLANVK